MITLKLKHKLAAAVIMFAGIHANAQEWTQVGTTLSNYAGHGAFLIAKDGNLFAAYDNMSNANVLNVQKFNPGTDWDWYGARDFSRGPASVFCLAGDNNNVPYVAYRDMKRNERCIVQKFDGETWSDVGAEVSTGYVNSTALAFDKDNTPYVAFADQANGKLAVSKFVDGTWRALPFVLDATGDQVNLLFDKDGALNICYSDTKNGNKATVKKFNGTTWAPVGGVVSDKEAIFVNFGKDNKDVLYVAYKSNWDGSIQLKKFDGSTWTNVGGGVFNNVNSDNVSLAFDANDVPYVGYHNYSNFDHKMEIKKFVNSAWVTLASAGTGGGGVADIGIYKNEIYVLFKEDGHGMVVKKAQL